MPDLDAYTEVLEAFLAGQILKLRPGSSKKQWLAYAWYLEKKQALELWQTDGHFATYGNVSREEAAAFFSAESRGKWVHGHLKAGYLDNGKWYHAKPYTDEIHADSLPDVS